MAEELIPGLNVSRETHEKLKSFQELVEKWSKSINLVSKHSLSDVWARHIQDSAQLCALPILQHNVLDIGSGGGFPAVVIAAVAQEFKPDQVVTCVESDKRKSVFLRTVARKLNLNIDVLNARAEELAPQKSMVLSARAMTSLSGLLGLVEIHRERSGIAVFPKGKSWSAEISEAEAHWDFRYDVLPSLTDPDAAILIIHECNRR